RAYQYVRREPSGEKAGLSSRLGCDVSFRAAPPAAGISQSVEYSSSPPNGVSTRVYAMCVPSCVQAIWGEKIPPGSVGAIVHAPLVSRRAWPPEEATTQRWS